MADRRRIYVVQKHYASHLHYDFRLEFNGVLRSWAVPKTPPVDEDVKRLAVETEDHPLSYADFEGEIAEGLYGAGRVEIWDRGTFELEKIEEGQKIVVVLEGSKLRGTYVLLKLKPGGRGDKNWLLFKKKEKEEKKEEEKEEEERSATSAGGAFKSPS